MAFNPDKAKPVKLKKQTASVYQPTWWQTECGRFTVEDVSHRNSSGARHAKTFGYKYEVVDHQVGSRYRASTLRDSRWWINEQLRFHP